MFKISPFLWQKFSFSSRSRKEMSTFLFSLLETWDVDSIFLFSIWLFGISSMPVLSKSRSAGHWSCTAMREATDSLSSWPTRVHTVKVFFSSGRSFTVKVKIAKSQLNLTRLGQQATEQEWGKGMSSSRSTGNRYWWNLRPKKFSVFTWHLVL